ncbi:MAG: proline racemase family protein, partial [Acidimicrobiia bacterium]|nr:proline racemase family protein [Acidimicrobiia bacterium]
ALASAGDLGWQLDRQPVASIAASGTAITAAVNAATAMRHPDSDDLGFLYGTIITDGVSGDTSTNVCVFADSQVDRSPTGSGVQARLAAEYARGTVALGETRRYRSIVGSEFTGRVIDTALVGDTEAVVVEVGGKAFYTGESRFTLEGGDELDGFLVS